MIYIKFLVRHLLFDNYIIVTFIIFVLIKLHNIILYTFLYIFYNLFLIDNLHEKEDPKIDERLAISPLTELLFVDKSYNYFTKSPEFWSDNLEFNKDLNFFELSFGIFFLFAINLISISLGLSS